MKNFKIPKMFLMMMAFAMAASALEAQSWLLTGNNVSSTDAIGTNNNLPLNFRVNGGAAGSISPVYNSVFMGPSAGRMNSGNGNNGYGASSLENNTGGYYNNAIGQWAMQANTFGYNNNAMGTGALSSNYSGYNNVAIGSQALSIHTQSYNNIAIGANSMSNVTSGSGNVAIGTESLYNNSGWQNHALGYQSLYSNTSGAWNVGLGAFSLYGNTTGYMNTAVGHSTLWGITGGTQNTGLGYNANASTGGISFSTVIGQNALVNTNFKVRLGAADITVVEGQVPYSNPSDGRFKFNVTEDVKGLDFITKLRPVVYNFDTRKYTEFLTAEMPDSMRQLYLKDADFGPSTAVRQTGFIAQEVEEAAKAVGYDFNGVHAPENERDNYSLAYAQFVMPLVKSVQELNAANLALQARLDEQERLISELLAGKSPASGSDATDKAAAPADKDQPFLGQNVPNPAGDATLIQYHLPETLCAAEGKCLLNLYDAAGNLVQTHALAAGTGAVRIATNTLSNGQYHYQLVAAGTVVAARTMIVTR